MNKPFSESAVDMFLEGFSCSQAVLAAFFETCDIDRETATKIADGFGGGMARTGLTCGAVTGAVMVIGLRHGRKKALDTVREFMQRFAHRNGSIACRDLIGCDISTEEGYAHALTENLFHTVCPNYVGDTAEILEELL